MLLPEPFDYRCPFDNDLFYDYSSAYLYYSKNTEYCVLIAAFMARSELTISTCSIRKSITTILKTFLKIDLSCERSQNKRSATTMIS